MSQKKSPPLRTCGNISKTAGNFSIKFYLPIMHTYVYARLRIVIQISATLTKLCHIKRDHPVKIMCAKCPPSAETHFLTFFPKQLGIFSPNFTRLLNVHMHARRQIFIQLIFIQLSATVTKLCHIKRDRHNVNVHHRPKRTLCKISLVWRLGTQDALPESCYSVWVLAKFNGTRLQSGFTQSKTGVWKL